MARGCEVLVVLAGLLAVSCGNSTEKESPEAINDVVKEAKKNCFGQTTRDCAYLDFLDLMGELVLHSTGNHANSRGSTSVPDLPMKVPNSDEHRSGISVQMVNHLLTDRMFRRLMPWTVSAYTFGNSTLQKLWRFVELQLAGNQEFQRGRRFHWWRYLGSLLLTLTLTIFSALISKALTLATISLLLSLLGLLGGLGGLGGGGSGGHGGHEYGYMPMASAYRSPTTVIATGRYPGVQYPEEPEDPANPYVYVNRKNWQHARSVDFDIFRKYHYEE